MENRKKIYWIMVITICVFGHSGCFLTRMPSPQADRIDGNNIIGIDAGGSFTWFIPTKTGVVLVDSGWEEKGYALKKELADRQVHAIFITHGHFDHTGGLPLFPDVPVYIGPGEGPLVRGEIEAGGWMARITNSLVGHEPYSPPLLKELADGESIEIDGEIFQAIHVPGHTRGSTMYLWKDVLFTGDTIVGRGDHVNEIPEPTYDDYEAVHDNVSKVLEYTFERIADGHVGLHSNAYEQVVSYLEK
ncbi:MAG: MBL fold metallo-hydrolase [SAR324 cluster bacterium]|nr:MBL fold metallo-hydrolase [SAR324 cluster bacterium]